MRTLELMLYSSTPFAIYGRVVWSCSWSIWHDASVFKYSMVSLIHMHEKTRNLGKMREVDEKKDEEKEER